MANLFITPNLQYQPAPNGIIKLSIPIYRKELIAKFYDTNHS